MVGIGHAIISIFWFLWLPACVLGTAYVWDSFPNGYWKAAWIISLLLGTIAGAARDIDYR